ncbi:hypothetical protein BAE44_0013326 [Dichanthelium oligosanthes]|uniref:Acetyltransferase n=1 Tax=Dichanthelium oligosanthes TaxID=888268 RepID=A0A1E5VKJ7_9POAL|nr:hypothetical protein BAE44_0013326 [Dichanthelium oligosanthes]
MAGRATASISFLQALLAHLWRAVCRARRLLPEQSTSYSVIGRVHRAGEIEKNGVGWAAWLLNRTVASFDEARMRDFLERWVQEPAFTYTAGSPPSSSGAALFTGSSPRFDMLGNDFVWGKPLAVRGGAGNNLDGIATVFEGSDKGGSMSLEVRLTPDVLDRLVADEEFMDAVTLPASG